MTYLAGLILIIGVFGTVVTFTGVALFLGLMAYDILESRKASRESEAAEPAFRVAEHLPAVKS